MRFIDAVKASPFHVAVYGEDEHTPTVMLRVTSDYQGFRIYQGGPHDSTKVLNIEDTARLLGLIGIEPGDERWRPL